MVLPVNVSAAVWVSMPLVLCAARAVRVASLSCFPFSAVCVAVLTGISAGARF